MARGILLISILLFAQCLCLSALYAEVPQGALDVAEAYLRVQSLDAALGDPYARYVMDSQDLLKITKDETSLLANAVFVGFDFPYLINGKPRGIISVRKTGDDWEYNSSSGQEQLFDVVHDIRVKRSESTISLLAIDSHRFFAIVEMKDKVVLIPKNKHTQDLFKGTIYEDEQFPWISYSIAYSVLREYASETSGKECIKHEE